VAATDNSIYEAAAKIESHLNANISTITYKLKENPLPAPFTTLMVSWIGASFTTPNAKPWIRNSVVNIGIIDQDASNSYEINRAQFTFGVFFPKGHGRAAMDTGKQIKDLFTREIFDDLVIEQVTVSPTAEPDSSPWFGVQTTIIFTYEGFVQ
jgi:hypothetical protein